MKNAAEARRFMEMVARKQGWRLSPDADFLDGMADGLATNHGRYGYYLCPCREGWGERDKDADIICPCEYCPPDIAAYGHCYCGLFLDSGWTPPPDGPDSIPDRRPEDRYPD